MTRYQQNPEIAWRRVDGDVLVVDPGQAQIRQLNATAAAVWEALESPRSIDELVEAVCARFDTTPQVARPDVESFLGELRERDLVTEVPA